MTGDLSDDEPGDFRLGRGCVGKTFTLKQIGEKNVVYVGFIDLEKPYDRVNKETLWQELRMYGGG